MLAPRTFRTPISWFCVLQEKQRSHVKTEARNDKAKPRENTEQFSQPVLGLVNAGKIIINKSIRKRILGIQCFTDIVQPSDCCIQLPGLHACERQCFPAGSLDLTGES